MGRNFLLAAAAALVCAACAGPAPAGAGAGQPAGTGSGIAGAATVDRGVAGGDPWKLIAYGKAGQRCLDVLFRDDPCRRCSAAVPRETEVEYRRHTYLQGPAPLTFVAVEASERVQRVELEILGGSAVELRTSSPFGRRESPPPGLRRDFRYAIVSLPGDAVVTSVVGFNRRGRVIERHE